MLEYELSWDEPKPVRDWRLLYTIALALVFHIIFLSQFNFELPEWISTRSIEIRLIEPKPKNTVPEQIEQTRSEPVLPETIMASPVSIPAVAAQPGVTTPPRAQTKTTSGQPAETGLALFQRALDSARKGTLSNQQAFGSEQELNYQSGLPTIISQPTQIESYDQMGFTLTKITDGNGGVLCIQERGEWTDLGTHWRTADKMKNRNLNYLVKDAMCGHLK